MSSVGVPVPEETPDCVTPTPQDAQLPPHHSGTPPTGRTDDWYDAFWDSLEVEEDDGISAARLIGEMYADGVIRRDGDDIIGRNGCKTTLTAYDQLLVRRIIEAVDDALRRFLSDCP